MDVYLVQHGLACPEAQDPQRPLTDRGRAAAVKMAEYLATRRGQLIDPQITTLQHSGKLRAEQTAEVFARALCPDVRPTAREGISPNDDPAAICHALEADRDRPEAVMVIGHLPHLASVAGLLLAGDAGKSPVAFVNAAVLKVRHIEAGWAMVWYLTPDCVS